MYTKSDYFSKCISACMDVGVGVEGRRRRRGAAIVTRIAYLKRLDISKDARNDRKAYKPRKLDIARCRLALWV